MKYFKIEYSCGCGPNEEYIIADSLENAEKEAYYLAVDNYESYAGYHGIPSIEEVAEDMFEVPFDELTEGEVYDAEIEYYQQMESWLSYSATEITKEEYDELMEN
jgi:hypothetical protein